MDLLTILQGFAGLAISLLRTWHGVCICVCTQPLKVTNLLPTAYFAAVSLVRVSTYPGPSETNNIVVNLDRSRARASANLSFWVSMIMVEGMVNEVAARAFRARRKHVRQNDPPALAGRCSRVVHVIQPTYLIRQVPRPAATLTS
jgi:hypothetical protein